MILNFEDSAAIEAAAAACTVPLEDLRRRIPVDSREDRLRALEAYPRTLELALEGGPSSEYYWGLIAETHLNLAFWAACPWRWFN
jgi:hypothetical protein